jgi:riboflavin biosynthesis pyrimidine reductase
MSVTVRALLPQPSDTVDLIDAYAPPPDATSATTDGAPRAQFVRCNMISTVDGAISLNGVSGALGGPPDRRVFQVLRSWADVVVVGAGTMRAEHYGPVRLDDDLREARTLRGQAPVPPVAVVTGSGDLDWAGPFFTDAEVRPIVLTTTGSADRVRSAGGQVAEVVAAGDATVDPATFLARLADDGYRSVLLEGGPGLNADVVHAGLLQELCLTLSPMLVAGSGPRVFAGPELAPPIGVHLVHLLEESGFFFLRLSLQTPAADPPSG